MLPLFDMMMQAQNGNAMDVMAKQFGLAQEQMAKATAALMPAFSAGLKRSTTNPYDFSALMGAMTSGNHAKYFEDITAAFTPQGMADGNGILGQLFGSKQVSSAIAAQAAQMTGIGQDIYKQMLPAMANTIMGGLFKQTTGQMGQNPFAGNPMMAMAQQWMEATGFARKPEPQPSFMNPLDNPFTQAMQGFFGMGQAEQKPLAANPFADNPFAKAFQDMMKGTATASQAEPTPEPGPSAAMAPLTEMFNTMFDSGLEAQKDYQKNIDALLMPYMNGGRKPDAS